MTCIGFNAERRKYWHGTHIFHVDMLIKVFIHTDFFLLKNGLSTDYVRILLVWSRVKGCLEEKAG